ncbi:MAG: MBL fold metallo-hydrolase [Clostridium sp.]
MKIIDVTGVGTSAVFLIKGASNILFETGMAYAADLMVEKIKAELGDGHLDAVLLSHAHYDHIAGLPAVRKAWPDVTVYAAERAKEILVKPSALTTIRRLSSEAAEAAGMDWEYDYKDEDLRIDIALKDHDVIQIGDHRVEVLETIGHTKDSFSYIVDGELMLCSESVGVLTSKKQYMPTFLVDYKESERSIIKSKEFPVKYIILNHYGLVSEEDKLHIWDFLLDKARESKKVMIEVMNTYDTEEKCLRVMEEIFHTGIDKKEQPDEAFDINALSMMRTLHRQFPVEFMRETA